MLLSRDRDPNYHTPVTTANMLQLDNRQTSLLKRSGTLWRRLSKRQRPDAEAAQLEYHRRQSLVESKLRRESADTFGSASDEDFKPPKPLRRTTTESDFNVPAKGFIAHYQRIEVPAKMPVLKTTRPKSSRARQPKPRPTVRVEPTAMLTTGFPASSRVRTVAWDVFLAPEAVHAMWLGFSPVAMEDKWFIYSEGPDRSGKLKVHFHRSWTGMKIAELFVVIDLKGEGAGKIVGIKWNGSEQTNGMSEEEAKYMITMSCRWVMGVDLEKGM